MGFFLLCVYLVNFYIRPQDWVSFFWGWPVDYIIIIPAIFIGVMEGVAGGKDKKTFILPVYYFIGMYLLIVALSNIVHGDMAMALDRFVFFLKKVCVFVMFALIINTPQRLKRIMQFLVILSCVLAIQGITQSIQGVGWAGQGLYQGGRYGMRVKWVGYWDGANTLALGLAMAIPLALGVAGNGILRLFFMLCCAILGYGVYLTNSRGGFVALASIVPLFIWTRFKSNKKYIFLIASILVIPLLMHFGPSRVKALDTKEDSSHERRWLWESGLNMLRENPILGVGKGHFKDDAPQQQAHSNFVQNFGETGLVGFFFWLGMTYLSFKGLNNAKKVQTKNKPPNLEQLINGILLSFGAFSVGTIFVTAEIEVLYILLGLSASALIIAKKYDDNLSSKLSITDVRNIGIAMMGVIFLYYLLAIKEMFQY